MDSRTFHEFARDQGFTAKDDYALDEEVGRHLIPWLLDWCLGQAAQDQQSMVYIRDLNRSAVRFCLQHKLSVTDLNQLESAFRQKPILMLMYIHAEAERLIGVWQDTKEQSRRGEIEQSQLENAKKFISQRLHPVDGYLDDGGSAWQVDWENGGLRSRIVPETQGVYNNAVTPDDAISEYLREAWRKAWGFKPDGDGAYRDAVDALEAAFGAIVLPNSDDRTLGKIVKALTDKPSKWDAGLPDHSVRASRGEAIDGVQNLATLLDWIWRGSQRHGKPDEYVENTLSEARDAVVLAVALIQLQRRNFLYDAGSQRSSEA